MNESKVCSCYREQTAVIYEDEKFKTTIISKCLGTKEQEICSCNGDKSKCSQGIKWREIEPFEE